MSNPALRLIYDNENNSKELIKTYKINGIFTQKKIKFELEKHIENEDLLLEFLEKSKTHIYNLQVEPQKLSTSNPPRPFCTSKLLQTANSLLQMSPKETMNHCQQLYQNGFITYMRTENTQYSKDFVNKAKSYIKILSMNHLLVRQIKLLILRVTIHTKLLELHKLKSERLLTVKVVV